VASNNSNIPTVGENESEQADGDGANVNSEDVIFKQGNKDFLQFSKKKAEKRKLMDGKKKCGNGGKY
jgi:hypothetical protein